MSAPCPAPRFPTPAGHCHGLFTPVRARPAQALDPPRCCPRALLRLTPPPHPPPTFPHAFARQAKGVGGFQQDDEEFEDSSGNVYNKKTYEDLKRQGLI